MRLSRIKLAGFKSFVDPTAFHLPSNLVGIVGPNGCGKSNIIDAVRWVMGESSARQLRGEAMADVIFNGSSSRKPVGQASVELIFDNSLGRLGGQWAQYAEISVKRLVSRDGQSSYFLNGARCRRRDITDLFLGTGLGPRSYAIIEQGMISRLVEAKPEELRLFLEEAAGISKYKERRRETENRIQHTRENLARLGDLRQELEQQLERLGRQARAAEQYQRLRGEERRCKAELLALRWRALDQALGGAEVELARLETARAALAAEHSALELCLEQGRARHETLQEAFVAAQARGYELAAEIARLEQNRAHGEELRRRQGEELQRLRSAVAQNRAQQAGDGAELAALRQQAAEAEPQLVALAARDAELAARLAQAEAEMDAHQRRWALHAEALSAAQRQAEVERARIVQLERQQLQDERRLERLRLERDGLDQDALELALETLREQEGRAAETLAAGSRRQAELEQCLAGLRQRQRELQAEQQILRGRCEEARGRLAALRTLQETALGRRQNDTVNAWLRARGLDGAPRLAEQLDVEPGWEAAIEVVLGERLEAVPVARLEEHAAAVAELAQGHLLLFEDGGTLSDDRPGLSARLQGPGPLADWLGTVRLAPDLARALAERGQLAPGESLVTADGIWVGRRWLRVGRGRDEHAGVLAREREIHALDEVLAAATARLEQLAESLEGIAAQLAEAEGERQALAVASQHSHREHARLQGEVRAAAQRLEHTRARSAALAAEQAELHRQLAESGEELRAARLSLEQALAELERHGGERQALEAEREQLQRGLEERRRDAADSRHRRQQLELELAGLRSRTQGLEQALARLQSQERELAGRAAALAAELTAAAAPLEELQARLQALLEMRLQREAELQAARRAVEEQDSELRQWERARQELGRRQQAQGQALEAARLQVNELRLRRQTVEEQLAELEFASAALLAELPETATEAEREARMESIGRRIQRLGPINLAAIEEYQQLAERKTYLDAQDADLNAALSTLESAMRKIDRETRGRFRDTYERVDQGLQRLFPRLFGGGEARLALTGEELLEAGVAILARPPGKRIGNIHLLSGGEKALTAVALVFAIFQLNPAPFCMLDEVDAPLDEANVGRFGALVRDLSEQVQFIFITHNKATMEIAQHLTGVTMHEPGVSRLVSVDVEAAVRLAAV